MCTLIATQHEEEPGPSTAPGAAVSHRRLQTSSDFWRLSETDVLRKSMKKSRKGSKSIKKCRKHGLIYFQTFGSLKTSVVFDGKCMCANYRRCVGLKKYETKSIKKSEKVSESLKKSQKVSKSLKPFFCLRWELILFDTF